MKWLGVLLIIAGFAWGSFSLVPGRDTVNWSGFTAAILMELVGVILLRFSTWKQRTATETLTTNIQVIHESLKRIVEKSARLNSEKESVYVYDLPERIDSQFIEDIELFVNSRESMAYAYSLPEYAEVMSHFAAGERHLNRVWSCSAEGYIDEAHDYLGRAQEQFGEAQARLQRIREAHA